MGKREEFFDLYGKMVAKGMPEEQIKTAIMAVMGISDPRYRAYKSEVAPICRSAAIGGYTIPAPAPRPFPQPLAIPDANALVIGDLHAPYHNRGLFAVALAVASAMGVRRTAFIGDIFNLDGINRHPKTGPSLDPEVDVVVGGGLLLAASSVMDELYIMKGNHDANMAKRLDKKWPMRLLISAALNGKRPGCRVFVTDRDWIHVGDTWDVGHLSQYSKLPGKLAANIADRRRRNVAVGHDHIQGYQSTQDGEFIGISVGAMLLPDRFWYREERLNDFPEWKNGFLIIRDGAPLLFNEHGSSSLNGAKPWGYWEAELGIEILPIFERYKHDQDKEQYFEVDWDTARGEETGTYEL